MLLFHVLRMRMLMLRLLVENVLLLLHLRMVLHLRRKRLLHSHALALQSADHAPHLRYGRMRLVQQWQVRMRFLQLRAGRLVDWRAVLFVVNHS